MDDRIECWICDHVPSTGPGGGQCRDKHDEGKLQKCGPGRVCMKAMQKGKEY